MSHPVVTRTYDEEVLPEDVVVKKEKWNEDDEMDYRNSIELESKQN
jgi:hypothetical protein